MNTQERVTRLQTLRHTYLHLLDQLDSLDINAHKTYPPMLIHSIDEMLYDAKLQDYSIKFDLDALRAQTPEQQSIQIGLWLDIGKITEEQAADLKSVVRNDD